MLEKPVDRRIIRTNRLIRDTLTELMKEKVLRGLPLTSLLIKQDINRGTFIFTTVINKTYRNRAKIDY